MFDCEMTFLFFSGTKNSNVKCKICSSGTFSDTESYTAPCLPHTEWVKESQICIQLLETLLTMIFLRFFHSCGSRAVVRKGNTTSDTVCEPEAFTSSTHTSKNKLPVNPVMTTVITTLYSPSAWEQTGSTQSVSEPVFNYSTKVPTQSTGAVSETSTLTGLVFWAVIMRRLISISTLFLASSVSCMCLPRICCHLWGRCSCFVLHYHSAVVF